MGQALFVTEALVEPQSAPCTADWGSTTDAPLAALGDSDLAERFRRWRGASGRRYLFTIFPLSTPCPVDDCPAYAQSVVLAVRRNADEGREILFMGDTGTLPELVLGSEALRAAVAAGANEIHLHLLARTAAARAAILADLGA